MNSSEIRQKYLDFFAEKDHLVLPSFSLVPKNDPSLLLVGAGMAPLKSYFTGDEMPPKNRMATCQKCIRTPDIEKVGKTARHATFFEMLGNFSFGDYFKEEAIAWAWEFVTEVLNLPPNRLHISIYQDDDEAFSIWHKNIGLSPDRITRLGKDDNFWEIGTGPCGPCSEIYYDLGEEVGCGKPDCQVGCDCDRFLEIWNLVFTQFNKEEDGSYTTLEQKNIDTGAGLERIAVVMQGVKNLFEIDTVSALLKYFSSFSGIAFGQSKEQDVSLKIITEHFRGVSFMISDGILPSNEGRGYVLRRLLRRAVRHGKLLGLNEPFIYKAVPVLADIMGEAYPDLIQRKDYIVQIIKLEEDRFLLTLDQGTSILEEHIKELQKSGKTVLTGETAFRLYDTFGFPLDLTKEILEEKECTVDEVGFNKAMEEQRNKARSAQAQKQEKSEDVGVYKNIKNMETCFIGYDTLVSAGKVQAIISQGQIVEEVSPGTKIEVILDSTPFYAERGGQVGDKGYFRTDAVVVRVDNTLLSSFGHVLHVGEVERGILKTGLEIAAEVDEKRRQQIAVHHTSTHLLHKALRSILGQHVNQAGSLVEPGRMRFDFNHFSSLTQEELQKLEQSINEKIWNNLPVSTELTDYQKAVQDGAVAIFDEKYTNEVRVVKVGDYSMELCGGTHVSSSGELGVFKITSESGIGTGLRRIEALSGRAAYNHFADKTTQLEKAAEILKTRPEEVATRVQEIIGELKEAQKENKRLTDKLATGEVDSILDGVVRENGVAILSAQVEGQNMDNLRNMADQLKNKLGSGIVVLGSSVGDKVQLVAAVTKDLIPKGHHAGKILKEVAKITGGGGGGRPDMAQAGGKDKEKLPLALEKVLDIVKDLNK